MSYQLPPRSQFYFGHEVTKDNNLLDFVEAATPLINRVATLVPKYYSPSEFAVEVSRALTAAGTQTYAVSLNRINRILTISSGLAFTLKANTGSNVSMGPWALLGLPTSSNYTGTSIVGVSQSGLVYRPQFPLLDYVPTSNIQDAVEATISETGSGKIETYRFGNKNLMECKISFINNYPLSGDSYIEQNFSGVDNARIFLQEIVKKGHIEFMYDRNKVDEFETVFLESTAQNSKGLGFRLREEFNYGEGFFTTDKLVFRKV